MSLFQIVVLAVIQGAAELLPVSSSAHVIVAEKLMGLDPSAPEMTFLLVMLHTGTMFAAILYFWPRWKQMSVSFLKGVLIATAFTGVVGLGLKKLIEKVVMARLMNESYTEIEHLFKSIPLIALALMCAGILIWVTGIRTKEEGARKNMTARDAGMIGVVQGLCLPFRGFSRSGATISTAMLSGISRGLAEDFSFALAVVLTPPVIVLERHRLLKSVGGWNAPIPEGLSSLLMPGILGMLFSFGTGLFALKWLSVWLERGKWKYFGIYCMLASMLMVLTYSF